MRAKDRPRPIAERRSKAFFARSRRDAQLLLLLGAPLAIVNGVVGCNLVVGIVDEFPSGTSATGGSTAGGAGGSTGSSVGGAGGACEVNGCGRATADPSQCMFATATISYGGGTFTYPCLRLLRANAVKFVLTDGTCLLHDGLPGSEPILDGPIAQACDAGADGCDLTMALQLGLGAAPCVIPYHCEPDGGSGVIVVEDDCGE